MSDIIHYDGNIAYADVTKATGLIRQQIEACAEPVYGYGVVFYNASKEDKNANKNVLLQRVPQFDIVETENSVTIR